MRLTKRERWLINRLEELDQKTVIDVERISNRAYDLRVSGGYNLNSSLAGMGFSAHLLRWAISEMTDWTSKEVARMTDYEAMARSGDWSGVRDTDDSKLWAIFEKFVVPQIEE